MSSIREEFFTGTAVPGARATAEIGQILEALDDKSDCRSLASRVVDTLKQVQELGRYQWHRGNSDQAIVRVLSFGLDPLQPRFTIDYNNKVKSKLPPLCIHGALTRFNKYDTKFYMFSAVDDQLRPQWAVLCENVDVMQAVIAKGMFTRANEAVRFTTNKFLELNPSLRGRSKKINQLQPNEFALNRCEPFLQRVFGQAQNPQDLRDVLQTALAAANPSIPHELSSNLVNFFDRIVPLHGIIPVGRVTPAVPVPASNHAAFSSEIDRTGIDEPEFSDDDLKQLGIENVELSNEVLQVLARYNLIGGDIAAVPERPIPDGSIGPVVSTPDSNRVASSIETDRTGIDEYELKLLRNGQLEMSDDDVDWWCNCLGLSDDTVGAVPRDQHELLPDVLPRDHSSADEYAAAHVFDSPFPFDPDRADDTLDPVMDQWTRSKSAEGHVESAYQDSVHFAPEAVETLVYNKRARFY